MPPIHRLLQPVAVAACLAATSGCTTALTTAYLRDTLWQFSEHASESTPRDATKPAGEPDSGDASGGATAVIDAERRAAAIEEAIGRLSRAGTLDPTTRRVLVETLERTQPEDWPVVVETFAESLKTEPPADGPAETPRPAAPETHTVAKTAAPEPAEDGSRTEVPAGPAAAMKAPAVQEASAATATPSVTSQPVTPPPAPPALAIRNACFASRVQAWGVVDRFPESRFHAGQEVIVYFELDNLEARAGGLGHTTCIDTSLRLVDDGGTQLHAWSFEPIAETCVSRRRDYFARYVLRIPETATAGPATIEIGVRDTLGGGTATGTLSLVVIRD